MKDLVRLIQDNPGCVAIIDNDSWSLWKLHPCEYDGPENAAAYDKWEKDNLLAADGEVIPLGDGGYGSGNCYGGDILQALATIVGMRVVSV